MKKKCGSGVLFIVCGVKCGGFIPDLQHLAASGFLCAKPTFFFFVPGFQTHIEALEIDETTHPLSRLRISAKLFRA